MEFESHVERYKQRIDCARSDYEEAMGIVKTVCQNMDIYHFGSTNQELENRTDLLKDFARKDDLSALLLGCVRLDMDKALPERLASFQNANILCKHIRNDFRAHVEILKTDTECLLETEQETEELLDSCLEKLIAKWKIVDDLFSEHGLANCKFPSVGHAFDEYFEDYYGIDTVIDKGEWLYPLKNAHKLLANVPNLKAQLAQKINLPLELMNELEDKNVLFSERKTCSPNAYINELIAGRIRSYEWKSMEDVYVIGEYHQRQGGWYIEQVYGDGRC